jgi:hypothetical protein
LAPAGPQDRRALPVSIPRSAGLVAALAVLAVCPAARGGPGLLLGVDDDGLKWTEDTPAAVDAVQALGLGAVRITLHWPDGQTKLDADGRTYLRRAQAAARLGVRVVLAVYGNPSAPPLTAEAQTAYCAYLTDALSRARNVRDVVIWNEVNSALFWRPQQSAAAAYQSLLATCYDVLHKYRREVNVISSTSPHENPAAFIAQLGAAYRASGRTLPIVGSVGHGPYPQVSTESPLASHVGTMSLDQGDYVRLLEALTSAFDGTAQPVPGAGSVPAGGNLSLTIDSRGRFVGATTPGGPVTIWYLEDGFETIIPADKRRAYSGREPNRQLVHAVAPAKRATMFVQPDQVAQLRAAWNLAYCQPAVGAMFNFQLADEVQLTGWQSGLLWADGTPKPSYLPFKELVAAIAAGTVNCSQFSPALLGTAPAAK